MGGVFGLDDPEPRLPAVEHNIKCDPEAARVVIGSGLPITLFPLDVTLRTPFTRQDAERIASVDHRLAHLLATELETWFGFIETRFGRELTHLHDPLTAAILEPRLITGQVQLGLNIETRGEFTTGATIASHSAPVKNVSVVAGIDASRFYELFMNRVTAFASNDVRVIRPPTKLI